MEGVSSKRLDFSGQNIYVGIDVHHKNWKVHIYNDEFELKSLSQDPDVDRLCNYLERNYENAGIYLAYEAGFCGFWIQRAFEQKGVTTSTLSFFFVILFGFQHRRVPAIITRVITEARKTMILYILAFSANFKMFPSFRYLVNFRILLVSEVLL